VAAVQPAEGADPPPAEIAEFIKPKKDTAAALTAWNKSVGSGSLGPQLQVLQYFVLPLPNAALKLLYAIAALLNYDTALFNDVCGDLSWDLVRKVIKNEPKHFFSFL
jgi:hypothetical protein